VAKGVGKRSGNDLPKAHRTMILLPLAIRMFLSLSLPRKRNPRERSMPTSSMVSLSAVCLSVSPRSCFPPGNAI